MKLASLNIERSRHLPLVEAFLAREKPDVLCLQELCARDITFFEGLMGGNPALYAPMMLHPAEVALEPVGVAILARAPLLAPTQTYYFGNPNPLPTIRFEGTIPAVAGGKPQKRLVRGSVTCVLLAATVGGMRIATTHLTVTPHGESTPEQLADAANLLALAQAEAATHGGLLLCGDFNAPRGRPTFAKIADAFMDSIPTHYTTSLDPQLHRAGALPYMVDGLFHTPNYKAEQVTLHTGVSDHMAITATLARNPG